MHGQEPNYSYYNEDGVISPKRIGAEISGDIKDIERGTGISRDGLVRKNRVASPKTQRRLREFVEIIELAKEYQGNGPLAFAWYRTAQLSGFNNRTPEELFNDNKSDWVLRYIRRKLAGGYA